MNLEDNYCVNKKEISSIKEKIEEFAYGPCSPVMLIPGVLSTKLSIKFDCETFRENNPTIFTECGWNSCDRSSWNIFNQVPKEEYTVWIPHLFSPMSIVEILRSNMCFSKLISAKYDFNKPIDQ